MNDEALPAPPEGEPAPVVLPDELSARAGCLSAAAQATEASATLLRFSREGPDWPGPFGHDEPIEKLADATKMAIEASIEMGEHLDEDRGQLLAALVRYLEGWCG